MKKILFFTITILISISGLGQTGMGWGKMYYKVNIEDTLNIATGWKIDGVTVTATAPEINSINSKADTVDQAFTGTTTISDLRVGNILSPRLASTDSLVIIPAIGTTTLVPFIGADTGFVYIRKDMRVELSTVVPLLGDTLVTTRGQYYTQRQVDSLKATINGYSASRLEFIVDTTAGAPATGDSILTLNDFVNKHIEVWRGADGDSLFMQYRKPVGQKYHGGYSFQKATGTVVFTPHFETNNHVIIEVTDSTSWTNLAFADTLGSEMITNGAFADGSAWTAATGWTIGTGVATYDDVNNAAKLSQIDGDMVISIEPLTTYRLTFTLNISSGNAQLYFVNSAGSAVYKAIALYSVNGTKVVRFTTPASIAGGGLGILGYTGGSTMTFTIDNVSLKEVL